MPDKGIINTRFAEWKYTNYFELLPNPKYAFVFATKYAPHTAKTKLEDYTDDDWSKIISEEPPPADKEEKWIDMTYILDHHALMCYTKKEVKEIKIKEIMSRIFRTCLVDNMPKSEKIFHQTRRFDAGILVVFQGKSTQYGGKRATIWTC